MFVLANLTSPYNELLQQNDWNRYVAHLNEEALTWWFNLQIPVLAAHLVPLASASRRVAVPPRLRFLSEAVNMTVTPATVSDYYQEFQKTGDSLAAAAAAGAVVLFTFEMGAGFDALAEWRGRIDCLLRHRESLAPSAVAGLWHYRSVIGACLESDAASIIHGSEKALAWTRRAGVNNLRAHAAIFHLFGCMSDAEFAKAESIFADLDPLCDMADVDQAARTVLRSLIGVHRVARGDMEKSDEILKRNLPTVNESELPTHSKMQVYNHATLHAARIGDMEALHRLCGLIQGLSFPLDRPFHSSYLNFVLGISFLNTNQLEKALFHVQRAQEKGKESKSPLCQTHIAMLQGQVLAEMGEIERAGRLFDTWRKTWRTNHHTLYVIAAEMEMAHLLARRGRMDAARARYEIARNLWPLRTPIYVHGRSTAFVESLESDLFSSGAPAQIQSLENIPPITIQAFGELTVRTKSAALTEHQWKSGRAKQLLKALIVSGAENVPDQRLKQLLWPEATDPASGLKSAVRRLRDVGALAGVPPLEWVIVRNRRVSLSPKFCRVDTILFQERLASAIAKGDIREIQNALDLYTDDFLKNELNEAWIMDHREKLKSIYARGILALADRCEEADRVETAVSYLKKAVARIPFFPQIHRRLIEIYLCGGAPSKAHQVYRQAARIFESETGKAGREALKGLTVLLKEMDRFDG